MDQASEVKTDPRRALPPVDRLVAAIEAAAELPRWATRAAARRTLDEARAALAAGGVAPDPAAHLARALELAAELARPRPQRVVNATGVVLHTNLGRAALAPAAARAVADAAAGYSDLELDLASGERGDRQGTVAALLAQAAGAEGAHVVNNNAAAVLLLCNTLAQGREVIVSRGELVEIGGSFRVPEVLERAGVRLVEVGTTNRTRLADYAAAVGPETALLLKVHRSNFEQRGFVEETGLEELCRLGRERGLPVAEDLGSASLVELAVSGLPPEAYAPARLRSGVDLLCFSGDKLLGGPQAGILLGRAEPIARLRRNPLARALRLDKLSLAALDATLRLVLEGRAEREVPTLRQLLEPASAVEKRARELAARLHEGAPPGLVIAVEPSAAPVGGGSLPGFELESFAVSLRGPQEAGALAAALRRAPLPVLGRVRDGRVLLDARTLLPGDEDACVAALRGLSG